MNNLNSITVSMLIMLLGQTFVIAQNPLRAAPQNQTIHRETRESSENRFGQSNSGLTRQNQFVRNPNEHVVRQHQPTASYAEPPRHDTQIRAAGFQEIPKTNSDQQQISRTQPSPILGSTVDVSWQDPNQILDFVMKVSLNLVFVLSFAFGVILIAKRWVKPKDGDNGSVGERVRSDSLTVLQTLKIDPKISIRLVQWRSNRFLVACDQNGIQSVNTLSDSFDQTLKELDEDVIDDKLVKKLLASMELNSG